MRKLLYAALVAVVLSALYGCGGGDAARAAADSARRADSLAEARAMADSMALADSMAKAYQDSLSKVKADSTERARALSFAVSRIGPILEEFAVMVRQTRGSFYEDGVYSEPMTEASQVFISNLRDFDARLHPLDTLMTENQRDRYHSLRRRVPEALGLDSVVLAPHPAPHLAP